MPTPWPHPPMSASGDWQVIGPAASAFGEVILYADIVAVPPVPPVEVTDADAWSVVMIVPTMTIVTGSTYEVKVRMHRATGAPAFWTAGTQRTVMMATDVIPPGVWMVANNDGWDEVTIHSGTCLYEGSDGATWHALDANNGYWTMPTQVGRTVHYSGGTNTTTTLPTYFGQAAIGHTESFFGGFTGVASTDYSGTLQTGLVVQSPSHAFLISTNPAQVPPMFFTGSTPYDIGAE